MKRRTCVQVHDHMLCVEALITRPSVAPKCISDKQGTIKPDMIISTGACHINQHEHVLGECVHVLPVCLTQFNHECWHWNVLCGLPVYTTAS